MVWTHELHFIIWVKGVLGRAVRSDWHFVILKLSSESRYLDLEDDFCSGCWNGNHYQQSFSRLTSPGRSNFIEVEINEFILQHIIMLLHDNIEYLIMSYVWITNEWNSCHISPLLWISTLPSPSPPLPSPPITSLPWGQWSRQHFWFLMINIVSFCCIYRNQQGRRCVVFWWL